MLITAAPVDRRRSFAKWCEKNSDFALADGGERRRGLGRGRPGRGPLRRRDFGPGALELLLARIGANTRLLVEEVHKLATHAGEGA